MAVREEEMPNTNKRRGRYFEDKIAKDYQDLFGLSKHECYRAGSSGARTSIECNGDVSFSIPENYPLITECKFYRTLRLDHIFPICRSYVDDWIDQVKEEETRYTNRFGRSPLSIIVCSRPYLKDYYIIVCNPPKIFDLVKNGNFNQYLMFHSDKHNKDYVLLSYELYIRDLLRLCNII